MNSGGEAARGERVRGESVGGESVRGEPSREALEAALVPGHSPVDPSGGVHGIGSDSKPSESTWQPSEEGGRLPFVVRPKDEGGRLPIGQAAAHWRPAREDPEREAAVGDGHAGGSVKRNGVNSSGRSGASGGAIGNGSTASGAV